ncbi:MAG: ribonuclease III [Anaerolineales bacterium]
MTPEEFARHAGLQFSDLQLVRRALTHSSYINENPDALEDNERLEFLGDAAIDFLSAAWLYRHFPEMDEGQLTHLRSSLVRTEQLAEFAEQIQLGEAVLLGRGEEASGGRERGALLCDVFEALIGALYMDSGIESVAQFLEPRFSQAVERVMQDESLLDPRSLLQIWAQAELGETPRYRTVEAIGPDHAREFVVEVSIGRGTSARGAGRSKQEAAQAAASTALSLVRTKPGLTQ